MWYDTTEHIVHELVNTLMFGQWNDAYIILTAKNYVMDISNSNSIITPNLM